MTRSLIEWTNETWNPVRGCSRVSTGCENCYAERQAHRFSGPGQPYEGLTTLRNGRPAWTGSVRFVPEMLDAPLRWRKPRMVFVNSMSDLFHEKVSDEDIAKVCAVIAACPHHIFQVLTKRPKRMLALLGDSEFQDWAEETLAFEAINWSNGPRAVERIGGRWDPPQVGSEGRIELPGYFGEFELTWPLQNLWLGVSVENQAAADERIPLLLQTPAAVRWVSCEPLLGPIQFAGIPANLEQLPGVCERDALCDWFCALTGRVHDVDQDGECSGGRVFQTLDWVVVGSESGPGARPMDENWVRSIREQCIAAGVPLFYKQRLENGRKVRMPRLDGVQWALFPKVTQ